MYYKIGVICVYNGHVFYNNVVITWQSTYLAIQQSV